MGPLPVPLRPGRDSGLQENQVVRGVQEGPAGMTGAGRPSMSPRKTGIEYEGFDPAVTFD